MLRNSTCSPTRYAGRSVSYISTLWANPYYTPFYPSLSHMAREKGFKTVLTSNGTLLPKAMDLLDTLPHKIQLSLHSHESNAKGELASYMNEVMTFSTQAAEKGTCIVLRLWNQGGKDRENEEVMEHIEKFVPKPWKERPDGYRLANNLYLEFDRKFEWPNFDNHIEEKEMIKGNPKSGIREEKREVFCKALLKQIGVLARRHIGTLLPGPQRRCGTGEPARTIARRNSGFTPCPSHDRRFQAPSSHRTSL